MGLGIKSGLSSLNKKRKKLTSSLSKELDRGAKKAKREAARHTEDLLNQSGIGEVFDFKEFRIESKKARQAQRSADAQQRKRQTKQKRAAKLEGAMIDNEIALRSKVAKQGGRRSLLSMGETGSLLL